jgi:hypothetical protein
MTFRLLVIVLGSLSLVGCASPENTANMSSRIVDGVPRWLGGLPEGVPPRRGTPEYEAREAERAKEAARDKSGDKKTTPQDDKTAVAQ